MNRRAFIGGAIAAAIAAVLPKKTVASQPVIQYLKVGDKSIHETTDKAMAFADGNLPIAVHPSLIGHLEFRKYVAGECLDVSALLN
jgi:hypothetical protein